MSALIPREYHLPDSPVLQSAVATVPGHLRGGVTYVSTSLSTPLCKTQITAQADAGHIDEVALPHQAVHVPRHLGLSRRVCNTVHVST